MELHTFSSLNKDFLAEYKNSMKMADKAIVYFSPHTLKHKKLAMISPEEVKAAFNSDNVEVYTSSDKIKEDLTQMKWDNANLLMMSSGNFDGIDFDDLANELI